MLSIYTAFIEKYFDDIQKWIQNITCCFALFVVVLVALWIGYFSPYLRE